MPETPPTDSLPPRYAAYPRAHFYGDVKKLQALGEGYFGLTLVFLVNLILMFGLWTVTSAVDGPAAGILAAAGGVVVASIIGFISHPYNKKIAYGLDGAPWVALTASILIGLGSPVCLSIVGFVAMQSRAWAEMKKYGVKSGFTGLQMKHVAVRIAELNAQTTVEPYSERISPGPTA